MTAFIDTSVLIRHLTGDPPAQAARATRFLAEHHQLVLADLVLAEMVYVLESYYRVKRQRVAELARAVVGFNPIVASDETLLLRAIELYEDQRLDFAEAYLCAAAEVTGVNAVASFDRRIDRIASVERLEP